MPPLTTLEGTPAPYGDFQFRKWAAAEQCPEEKGPLQKSLSQNHEALRRSVQFSTVVLVHPIIHHQDMSTAERSSSWMNFDDRKESKLDVENTIFLMRTGVGHRLTELDFFCARGLEHVADKATQKVAVKKSVSIALAMQRLLRKTGASNPRMIARAYRKYTLQSQYVAYRKALHDQEVVFHNQKH